MPDPFSFDTQGLPLPAQRQIDAVCIEFEDAWKSGGRPDIEGFVRRLPESLRSPLFAELLLIELDYRRRQGDTPSVEEYQPRFPGFEDVVVAIFERAATPDRGARSTPSHQSAQETPSATAPWTPVESGPGPGRRLGRFELRARLGAGGFGTVYRAYDTMLRREVALKLPHPGRFESEESQARVLREARAAAQLYHPYIVPVYDAGMEGETFFIASAFVEGKTLARFMDEGPREFREAATIVAKLAAALDYAHRRGIIHRDVKPANIMVGANGDPALMDFGLARFLESEDKLTHDGAVLGTPAYMSPEQAQGQHDVVGPASDQYSLGVVLYQLLCDAVPFTGTPAAVISDIMEKEPPAPRAVRPDVPRDLETICLKSLAKTPGERYPSCQQLADDLGRWSRGEPIEARPIGVVGRAWRWCKRRPMVAGLSAALVLALLIGSVVSMVFGVQATRNEHNLTVALGDLGRKKAQADAQRDRADNERKQAEEARDQADKETKRAEDERERAEQALQREIAERQRADANLYAVRIALAYLKWMDDDVIHAARELDACPEDLRNWEWGYLKRRCRPGLVSFGQKRTAHAWPRTLVFNPNGTQLAVCSRDIGSGKSWVQVWDTTTRREIRVPGLAPDRYREVQMCQASGRVLCKQGTQIEVRDAFTGNHSMTIDCEHVPGGLNGMWRATFAPEGQLLTLYNPYSWGELLTVWQVKNKGLRVLTRVSPMGGCSLAQFSPNGERIAACGGRSVWISELSAEPKGSGVCLRETGYASCLAFSPDSKRIAVGSGSRPQPWEAQSPTGALGIWDVNTGAKLLTLCEVMDQIVSTAFSPDGSRIAAASYSDAVVWIWDTTSGDEIGSLPHSYQGISIVAFSPDGKRIATAGRGGITIWSADAGRGVREVDLEQNIEIMALSPDRKRIAGAGPNRTARVLDANTGKETLSLQHIDDVSAVAFSADGKRLALGGGSNDKTVTLWDVATGQRLRTLRGHDGAVNSLAFSPDGSRIVSAGGDKNARVWDAAHGKELFVLSGTLADCDVAFSPEGDRIVATGEEGQLRLWDAASGDEVSSSRKHMISLIARCNLTYSPNGKWIASGGGDDGYEVAVWDARQGRQVYLLDGHKSWTTCVAFSPDSERVASGSADRTIRIWDVKTGRELLTLHGTAKITNVWFSPDALSLYSINADKKMKIWEAEPWQEAKPDNSPSGLASLRFQWPESQRRGATLKVDEKQIQVPSNGPFQLHCDPGTHLILATYAGMKPFKETITVGPGQVTTITPVWQTYEAAGRKKLEPVSQPAQDRANRPVGAARGSPASPTARLFLQKTRSIAFSPDGLLVATAGSIDSSHPSNRLQLKLWNAPTGELEATLGGHFLGGFPQPAVVFSRDGSMLALRTPNGRVTIWEVATGHLQQTLAAEHRPRFPADLPACVAFSPDGSLVATSAADTIKLWDATSGELRKTLEGAGEVNSIKFTPDGSTLVSAGDDLRIWDTSTAEIRHTLVGHSSRICSLAVSHDGSTIASAGMDDTIRLWDSDTGQHRRTLEGHVGAVTCVEFKPDGSVLVSGSTDRTIRLWETTTGRLVQTLEGHPSWITCVAFSPDGKAIVSCDHDGVLKSWDPSTGKLQPGLGRELSEDRTPSLDSHGPFST